MLVFIQSPGMSMPTVEFHWLGPPHVEVDGQPIRLETRKITALLALLSVEQRTHSRERLAALFWPDYDSRRAPANLRRALSSLQASLGTEILTVGRETIEFVPSSMVRVDYIDFITGVEDIRSQISDNGSNLTASNSEKLRAALNLHQGDFLEGFNLKDCSEFDQWQTLTREVLFQHADWAMERLVEFDSANERWEQSIEEAQRWLALDNLNESAHRTLMFLFARSGKRSAALRQYENCTRLLREELDQDPDEQTRDLFQRIKQRKISTPRRNPAVPGISSRSFAAVSSDEALLTKLSPPQRRPGSLERARLFQFLDEGLSRPVTLISAPAGFGKTTLLCEWEARCEAPLAWLSLSEGDDTPERLFIGIASALGTVAPGTGSEALQMLRSIQIPDMSRITASILRDIAKWTDHRALVIDDYHLIRQTVTKNMVSSFIEQIPPALHLFISTRIDPTFPLARFRAQNKLVEIRVDELRFSDSEAAAFLREVMALDLSEDEIRTLGRRTEGWPAGLQMAALSLRGRENAGEYIRNFEGSHRYIMDYLLGEVMEKLSPGLQRFLLRTSILDRFCGPLCDAVTGREDSQATIETLEHENLFVVSLDEKRVWYRYHHLFAQLLRHRLKLEQSVHETALLHERAGTWLETRGDTQEAMRHYLAGKNYTEALKLMDRTYEGVLTAGGLSTLLEWAKNIPPEAISESLGGSITLGSLYAWSGRKQEAENNFDRGEEILSGTDPQFRESNEGRHYRGRILLMRAFIADISGRTEEAISLAQAAEKLLKKEQSLERFMVLYTLGRAYRYRGELVKAEECIRTQISIGTSAGNSWTVSGAVHELVWIFRIRGKLQETEQAISLLQAVPLPEGAEGPTAKVLADRGESERERGDLKAAEKTLGKALKHVEEWGLPSDLYFCRVTHGRLEYSKGNFDEAERDILHAETIARTSLVYSSLFPLLESERVRVYLAQGKLPQALDWLNNYPYEGEPSLVNRELLLITKARVLLAAGKNGEALHFLESLASSAESGGRYGRLLEIRVLQSMAAHAFGREQDALRFLDNALCFAGPEGYVRIFLDEGKLLLDLLRKHSSTAVYEDSAASAYAGYLADSATG